MTPQAQLWLRILRPNVSGQRLAVALIFCRQVGQRHISFGNAAVVNLMTIYTSHRTRLVRASIPKYLVAFGMA
jgi:hypothetical protein